MTKTVEKDEVILKLENVSKEFTKGSKLFGKQQVNKAVDGVSLELKKGEVLGLVGESGCGKSTLARVIMRLHEATSGEIYFKGNSITKLSERKLRPYRKEIQMIFQDPFASLNPRKTVGEILSKPYKVNKVPYDRDTIRENIKLVGLNDAYINRYPHEFSGGQRQRIGIGRSISLQPELVICDEPVSALDVSVQAQIINLLISLKDELQMSYIFISHDLSVVSHISDRIAVMYLGNLVEVQSKEDFYARPLHPYSEALLSAIPIANPKIQKNRERIKLIGELPSSMEPPSGCPFHPRCPIAQDICRKVKPKLRELENGKQVACHFPLNS